MPLDDNILDREQIALLDKCHWYRNWALGRGTIHIGFRNAPCLRLTTRIVPGNMDDVDSYVSTIKPFTYHLLTIIRISLTSILLSRLSLDLREVNGGYTDGGEVLTRTLRDIPDFVHTEDTNANLSVQLSNDFGRNSPMYSIDGKGNASHTIVNAHLMWLSAGDSESEGSDHMHTSPPV